LRNNRRARASAPLHWSLVKFHEGGAEDGAGGAGLDDDGAGVAAFAGGSIEGQRDGVAVPGADLAPFADDVEIAERAATVFAAPTLVSWTLSRTASQIVAAAPSPAGTTARWPP
jgi:hypothetical protein